LAHKIVCLDENTTAEVVQLGEDRWFVKDPNELINVRTKGVHQKVALGQIQGSTKSGFIVIRTVEHP
jgi:hypothetical protein